MVRAPHRLVAAALAVASCGPPSYPGPAQLVAGGGVYDFVPQPACARVAIVHGPQGGYHLWTSLRARYLDFSSVTVAIRYLDPRGGEALHEVQPFEVGLDAVDPGRLLALPAPAPGPASCPDGGDGTEAPPARGVPGGTDGWGQALALTGFLPPAWNGCRIAACYAEQAIRQEVTVTDGNGRSASDARTLWPYLAPEDFSVYCRGDRDLGVVAVDLAGVSCREP